MQSITSEITGSIAGLEALDQFATRPALAVVDLREQSDEDGTVLFCTFCYVDSDVAVAA
ncbi:MAG TPA: hypothetical protein VIT20_00705 [Propionibacteriaceae bacterium]